MQKKLITPCEAISWIGFKDFIKYRDPFDGPFCDEALRSDVYALCRGDRPWTPEEVLSLPSAGTDLGPERQQWIMDKAESFGGLDGFRRHLDFLSSEYFRYQEARKRLLEALAGGQIEAMGVIAGSLEHVTIPVVIWHTMLNPPDAEFDAACNVKRPVKKAVLNPLANTLNIQVDGGEREYTDLCLRQADVVHLWPEQGVREGAAGSDLPLRGEESFGELSSPVIHATTKSGSAGRPTSKGLMIDEMKSRFKNGLVKPTLAAETSELLTWLASAHPSAGRATQKAAENSLRSEYSNLKTHKIK